MPLRAYSCIFVVLRRERQERSGAILCSPITITWLILCWPLCRFFWRVFVLQRVEADGDWNLFCPNEAPGLSDTHSDEFKVKHRGIPPQESSGYFEGTTKFPINIADFVP